MKYRTISTNQELNIDKLKKYVIKKNNDCSVVIIEFDESEIDDIAIYYGLSELLILGEDDCLYSFTHGGCTKSDNKVDSGFLKKQWKNSISFSKKTKVDLDFKKMQLESCNETKIIEKNNHLFGFANCCFIDKETNNCVPFRFKKAKKSNMPLLIYFHGAGALGHDNMSQLLEFKSIYKHAQNIDCNILISQSLHGAGGSEYECRGKFIVSVAYLIEKLIKTKSIDTKRIYLTGASLGGGCVWQALFMYPELFAAAVPAMGELINVHQMNDQKFSSIKDIPIWIAHSSDDKVVSIKSDDYCFAKLKELGSNVKYSRWNGHGHNMYKKFYKKEPWQQWLFQQHKA